MDRADAAGWIVGLIACLFDVLIGSALFEVAPPRRTDHAKLREGGRGIDGGKWMKSAPIYVEIEIRSPVERVWHLTQEPSQHSRWDLRFSSITPTEDLVGGGYRFQYERRLPLHTIVGTGTSLGERGRPDGTRTSALKFTTRDPLSPLGDGSGYWRYLPNGEGVTFITGYNYEPGWGAALDALFLRRLIGWMTAWSFDRLRIWAETGVEPESWTLWSVLQFWRRDRPRAARCRRTPRHGHAMDNSPSALATLEEP